MKKEFGGLLLVREFFYRLHPENAIIKSIVFRLLEGRLIRLQNIFQKNALCFVCFFLNVNGKTKHQRMITNWTARFPTGEIQSWHDNLDL